MPEAPKARLEEILDEMEALLPVVRDAMASFKKFRDVATDPDIVAQDLTFAVIIDEETIPLRGLDGLDLVDKESHVLVKEAAAGAMVTRGEAVSKLWAGDIGPLVTEAIAICQRAGSEEDE